ncbi:MAG: hypothetical protein CL779_00435 [Chloroflexi bacterium]|nr:hypothetical protein [Chloroflexota bacterium]
MSIVKKIVNDYFDLNTLKHLAVVILFLSLISIFDSLDIKKINAQDNLYNKTKQLPFSVYQLSDYNSDNLLTPNVSSTTVESSGVSMKNIENTLDLTKSTTDIILEEQKKKNQNASNVFVKEPDQVPKYFRYKIQAGDSIIGIAEKFNVEAKYIRWNNIHLTSKTDIIQPGDMVRVPSVEGILHDVTFGETLSEIAMKYNASSDDIIDFSSNNIYDPNFIEENVTILVVNGVQPKIATDTSGITNNILQKEASAAGFVWPAEGPITSVMTYWHPTGIDIGALMNDPVVATNSGTVIFAGGDPCCSYGYYVDIRHPGGFVSRVAHLNKIWVSAGQQVSRGEIIGLNGSTGRSTGPHVHFELRRNGLLQNPLNYIPRTNLTFCDFC